MKVASIFLLGLWPWVALGAVPNALLDAGRPASVDVANQYLFNLKWRKPVVRMGRHRRVIESFGTPAAITQAQQIVVATGEGEVRSYFMATGELQWRVKFETDFETSVVEFSSSKDIPLGLVVDRRGKARALDLRNGDVVWATSLPGDCRAPVAVRGKLLIATTANNKVVALDKDTGQVRWTKGRAKPAGLTVLGHASPVVTDNRVYAAFSDGYVAAYELKSGKELWKQPLSIFDADFKDANATPILFNNVLYAASYSDGIAALDAQTGKVLWKIDAPAVTSMALADGQLFAASADGYIWGLQPGDGQLVFRTRLDEGPALGLQYSKGRLVLTGGESGLIVLSAQNGAPLQATALGSRAISAPAINGEEIALLTSAGYLYSFSAQQQATK